MSPTWAEVDLDAIAHNVQTLRRAAGVPVMAVVKADAYGHGAVPVARAALAAGAEWLAVARVEEGLALRAAGIRAPVLVLGWAPPEAAAAAVRHDLRLTVFDDHTRAAVAAAARQEGAIARVHVKVDTGMGRLGLPGWDPERAAATALLAAADPHLQVEGIYTHFARADEPDPEPTRQQLARFRQVLDRLSRRGLRPPLVHAANSAAALRFPEARYDLVRPGIALYGLDPYPDGARAHGLRPALRWVARVEQVRRLPPGWGVSYGHTYVAGEATTVAVLAAGYADGYPRALSNRGHVLVRGRPARVLGRVCMDHVIVGPVDPDLRPGEEAVLIGAQGGEVVRAEDLAAWAGTIPYEVVSRIGPRVPRRYCGRSSAR